MTPKNASQCYYEVHCGLLGVKKIRPGFQPRQVLVYLRAFIYFSKLAEVTKSSLFFLQSQQMGQILPQILADYGTSQSISAQTHAYNTYLGKCRNKEVGLTMGMNTSATDHCRMFRIKGIVLV